MKKQVSFYGWEFEVNYDQTKLAYSSIEVGGAASCRCIYCKNFSAIQDQAFPSEFLHLLTDFGVDVKKDVETYESGKDDSTGLHAYGGWYHFYGKTIKEGESRIYLVEETSSRYMGANFCVYFCRSNGLTLLDTNIGELVEINFGVLLPWVIDEKDDGEMLSYI